MEQIRQVRHIPWFFVMSSPIFRERRRTTQLPTGMKDMAAKWSKGKVNNVWNLQCIVIAQLLPLELIQTYF